MTEIPTNYIMTEIPTNGHYCRNAQSTTEAREFEDGRQMLMEDIVEEKMGWQDVIKQAEFIIRNSDDMKVLKDIRDVVKIQTKTLLKSYTDYFKYVNEQVESPLPYQNNLVYKRQQQKIVKRIDCKIAMLPHSDIQSQSSPLRPSSPSSKIPKSKSSLSYQACSLDKISSFHSIKLDAVAEVAKAEANLKFFKMKKENTEIIWKYEEHKDEIIRRRKEYEEELELLRKLTIHKIERDAFNRRAAEVKRSQLIMHEGRNINSSNQYSGAKGEYKNIVKDNAPPLPPHSNYIASGSEQGGLLHVRDNIPMRSPLDSAATSCAQELPSPRNCTARLPEQVPPTPTAPDDEDVVVDRIMRMVSPSYLPRKQPEVFTGNPINYDNWERLFTRWVERAFDDPVTRLNCLKGYTAGEAKQSIQHLLDLRSDEAYSEAKRILRKTFGDPLLIFQTLRDQMNEWPAVPPGDSIRLSEFVNCLWYCEKVIPAQYMQYFDHPVQNMKYVRKLPSVIGSKWMNFVRGWGLDPDERNSSSPASLYPPFSEFCHFLQREAKVASGLARFHCDPLDDGNEAQTQLETSRPGSQMSVSVNTEVPQPERPSNKQGMCIICKNKHSLAGCDRFKAMSLDDRKKFVQNQRLCRGCLRKGHRNWYCRFKMKCDICERRHPTLLHDYSIQ